MHYRRPTTLVVTLFALGIALLASAIVLVFAGPAAAQDDPPLLEPDGQAILDHILRVDPYVDWGSWESDDINSDDYSGYLPSDAPHGVAVRIYVNDIALLAVADPAFAGELPPGSIIVKENYTPTQTSPAELTALTVMVKLDDFYPRGGDWFWLKAAPDGSTVDAEGAVSGCLDCHQESASDYLLRYIFPGAGSPAADSGLDGDALINARCTVCHTRERIDLKQSNGADRDAWVTTVDRMISYGAQLDEAEREAVLNFLTGTAAAPSAPPPTSLDGETLITTRCTVCHTRERIDTASKDAAGWTATIDRMISYGAQLGPDEREALIGYLAERGATAAPSTTAGLDAEGLINERCTVCHSRERIDAASKDAAGWAATVDRMIGYGAQLSGAERDQVITYLAERGATIFVDPNDPEQIINVRCTVCHTRARIDDEDGDYEDWNETISEMESYGAQLTPQERQTLLNHLVATQGKDSGHGGGDDHDDDHD